MRQALCVLYLTWTLLLHPCLCDVSQTVQCPCEDKEHCEHPPTDQGLSNAKREMVFAYTRETTAVHLWDWDTINVLIIPSNFEISNEHEAHTMCTTHMHGRLLGITVDMDLTGSIKATSTEATNWISDASTKYKDWRAEIINIDLLNYFQTDTTSTSEDHVALAKILNQLKTELSTNDNSSRVTMTCTVPWQPPCAEKENSCDAISVLTASCDYFIINPDSFTDVQDFKCRARATIPFTKLLLGISEYNSHGVPNGRIVLGVPWHGYDYTCFKLENSICHFEEKVSENSTQTKCNFDSRKRMSYAQILTDHKEKAFNKLEFDTLYNAPYFTYKENDVTHQVWFENGDSLVRKYKLAHELKLKGIGIFYGDDLSPTPLSHLLVNENYMWSWVAHETFVIASKHSVQVNHHNADVVAGVAVGCLFGGLILGIVFTCIGLRSRIKKPKRDPFIRDANLDEYTDEDPNL